MRTGAQVMIDYRRHLKGIERTASDYKEQLRGFNARTAQRLLDLCFQNGGIYTKFGQQLATFNHALPREYTDTLAQLQDQAKPVSFTDAMRTVECELKKPWQKLFPHIDETPIAAASLAQVHRATDEKGRDVAVKIQYPHLEQQIKADLVVMRFALQITEYFFPNLHIQWMFPEFEQALNAEVSLLYDDYTTLISRDDRSL